MTLLLEEAPLIVTETTESNESSKVRHYFSREDIDANFLTGSPMIALCGYVLFQQQDPAGLPVCQECEDIFKNDDMFHDPKDED